MTANYGAMQVADYTVFQLMPDGSRNKAWASAYTDHNSGVLQTDVANRLAACWNACEGIRTTDLVALAGTGILAKANHNADVVVKQRDTLLAALEAIVADDYEVPHDAINADIAIENGRLLRRIRATARTAIAAAKGGA
ncbi:hypothetical protein K32_49240 [Kaistia sp. 32K]|uniref:hypothetical protein n=1 Tax=Kaistia sp. 32K TaxID=2795690 RepID=UPI001915C591|nr:hypothetical protein [Kaistia sp. 32K]BCP56307.1 hypothetical protein K32_49240 [Kaistia sp. 32K]